jgi:hypothetical protein
MQIILSKDDIEEIIKKVFDIEAMGWNKDGTITIDTVLEKLVNDKSKFNTDDLKRMLGRAPTQVPYSYIQPAPYIQPTPYRFVTGIQPGQTTINSSGIFSSAPKKESP